MKGYKQLTKEQRYQLKALLSAGHKQKEIAEILEVDPSTISRELRRNRGKKGYRPSQAQNKADERKQNKPRFRNNSSDSFQRGKPWGKSAN